MISHIVVSMISCIGGINDFVYRGIKVSQLFNKERL